jgi:hypothetical protein
VGLDPASFDDFAVLVADLSGETRMSVAWRANIETAVVVRFAVARRLIACPSY